jgi:hypothetical protein
MSNFKAAIARIRHKFALTPEQAETLAAIKFPCC